MIDKIEITMINENVHNFKKGEFGVESIEINEARGLIEIKYACKEGGERTVFIPLKNIEKCDYLEKSIKSVKSSKSDEKLLDNI
ncbi:MAG: hypothetical protein QME14_01440 [Methanobacteriaceae archaeon]|nr:hypothetical protein [Methanobacteriaceae archaeon]